MRRCRASVREFKAYIIVFYAFAEYLIIDKKKVLFSLKRNNTSFVYPQTHLLFGQGFL